MFHFHLIRTLADARALPPGTVGIEIVDPAMAQAILDGGGSNLDGQHGVPAGVMGQVADLSPLAAVDIAAQCAGRLIAQRHGTIRGEDGSVTAGSLIHVAFQRPDLDACAAAAVLVLHALGVDVTDRTRERLALIARADSFRTDGMRWKDWAPPAPTLEQPFPPSRYATVDGSGELSAVGAICSPNPRTGQPALPLSERVAITATWLLLGEELLFPGGADQQREQDLLLVGRIWGACGLVPADQRPSMRHPTGYSFYVQAAGALFESDRMIHAARLALVRESTVEIRDGVATVRSAHAGVSAIGYSRDRGAPVFVAIPPNCAPDPFHDPDAYRAHVGPSARPLGRKVTIATCSAAYLDVAALKAALNAAEAAAGGVAKWGGPSGMCCSPMAEGTVLDDDAIIAAVCAARVG